MSAILFLYIPHIEYIMNMSIDKFKAQEVIVLPRVVHQQPVLLAGLKLEEDIHVVVNLNIAVSLVRLGSFIGIHVVFLDIRKFDFLLVDFLHTKLNWSFCSML